MASELPDMHGTRPESLEDVFEFNVAFKDESIERSLGRLGWLRARLRAEIIAIVAELDITDAKKSVVISLLNDALTDICEFVEDGLDIESGVDMGVGDEHPQQNILNELCDQIEDEWDESEEGSSEEDLPAICAPEHLGSLDSRVIIEILKRRITDNSTETPAIE